MSLRELVHEMWEATYNGKTIRVEARILFVTDLKEIGKILTGKVTSYKLTIDDSDPIEKIEGFLGIHRLEGLISQMDTSKDKLKVVAIIDQGLVGTKYKLTIDGKEYELKKL